MSTQTEKIQELIDLRAKARLGGGEKAIAKQHEKGKLTARLCMHMKNTVTYHHFNDTFKLKNGKFSLSSTDTFKLLDEGGYYISSAKNVTYTKINGNKKSFTLKKGSKFYKTKLIVRKGNVFLLLKNTANKTGYINFKKLKYEITGTFHVGGGFVI